MGLIERLSNLFLGSKDKIITERGTTVENNFTESVGYSGADYDKNQAEYIKSIRGWSYACITAISDQIAAAPLRLYRLHSDGSSEEVFEHECLDALYKVNKFTTRFDHFWLTQAFLESVGEAFWYLESDETGKISNIFFLLPDKVTPVVSKNKIIEGYNYDINNERLKLPAERVIFFKYPNPSSPFRGLGTMEAAAVTIDLDNYSETWNKNFFKNSARPHTVLKVNKNNLSLEQRDRLKASIEKSYKGLDKAHGTMVLFGDMDVTPFGSSVKDMDWVRQQEYARDKILGIFRVPKAVVAQTEASSFAAAKTAQFAFAKWTIQPKLERFVQQLNEFYLPMFSNSEGLYLDFDNPIPEDDTYLLSLYNTGITNGWMTVNEVRNLQNLPAVEGGDELRPAGTLNPYVLSAKPSDKKMAPPARVAFVRSRDKEYFKFNKAKEELFKDIKDKLRKELTLQIKNKKQTVQKSVAPELKKIEHVKSKQWSHEKKMDFWNIKSNIHDKNVLKVYKAQSKMFKLQEEEVVGKLDSALSQSQKSIDIDNVVKLLMLDKKKEAKRYKTLMAELFNDIFNESASATAEYMKEEGDAGTIDISNINAESYIKSATTKVSNSITNSTNSYIKNELSEGISKGESNEKLAKRIVSVFKESESSRALLIARTETARYSERATLDVYKASGVVEGKEWVNNPDACEECIAYEGKVVGLDDTFDGSESDSEMSFDDLATPPLHPNCRCLISPVFK